MLTVFDGGAPFVSNAGTLDARGFGVTLGSPLRQRRGRLRHLHLRPGPAHGPAAARPRRTDHRLREGRVPRPRGARRDLHRLVGHAPAGALPPERAQRLAGADRGRRRGRPRPRPASTSSSPRGCRSWRRSRAPTGKCWWPCATCSTRRPRPASWTSSRFRTRRRGSSEASPSSSEQKAARADQASPRRRLARASIFFVARDIQELVARSDRMDSRPVE